MPESEVLQRLKGKPVVADLDGGFTLYGILEDWDPNYLSFVQADLHDESSANSTRDYYASETKRHGIRVNRQRVFLPQRRIVALALIEDVEG
jgi:small nuclear ribonucleoprotein (snRNP)-like protein